MIATRTITAGMLKILILSEILPVYLIDRLFYVTATVTGDKCGIFGRVAVEN